MSVETRLEALAVVRCAIRGDQAAATQIVNGTEHLGALIGSLAVFTASVIAHAWPEDDPETVIAEYLAAEVNRAQAEASS